MANNLFPETTEAVEINEQSTLVKFGKSWRFNFEKGEFELSPTNKITETDDVDAWVEWCRKAVATRRYRYMAYSRNYGHEFEELISRQLSRQGNESEIKRIATETLMVDPRTASVDNFTFEWDGDSVYFTCDIINIRDEKRTLSGSVVMNNG